MDTFENLQVWKRSSRLCSNVYQAFSTSREWGFKDQITRSALSVPSNIAEGYERNSRNEYARFLKIAKGSCGELRTQLYIAKDIQILEQDEADAFLREAVEISKILQGMIGKLKK
ncbi:MAG TPA: four helix bundle protein [Gammaproteobacteria bacterium]|nr:four helix bundle protein [Gammaproteobacteria bacterium]